MATIKEYLDYAELAQAAYGFLNIPRSQAIAWECIHVKQKQKL